MRISRYPAREPTRCDPVVARARAVARDIILSTPGGGRQRVVLFQAWTLLNMTVDERTLTRCLVVTAGVLTSHILIYIHENDHLNTLHNPRKELPRLSLGFRLGFRHRDVRGGWHGRRDGPLPTSDRSRAGRCDRMVRIGRGRRPEHARAPYLRQEHLD